MTGHGTTTVNYKAHQQIFSTLPQTQLLDGKTMPFLFKTFGIRKSEVTKPVGCETSTVGNELGEEAGSLFGG